MSLFSCLAYVCISSIQQGTDDASLIDLMLCFSHTLFSASTSQQQPCQFRDWSQHHVNGYRICKSSCTWICLQLLVMCHWLRWRVELGNSAPWPQFLWCWLWDRSHHKLLRSFSGVSEAIMSVACKSGIISEKFWRGHGWFLIRLGIGSSWTACHREEYADRSHPYKTWTHVTEGVRRRSRSVGASSQPPCLLFSVRDKIQRSQKQRKRSLGGDFFRTLWSSKSWNRATWTWCPGTCVRTSGLNFYFLSGGGSYCPPETSQLVSFFQYIAYNGMNKHQYSMYTQDFWTLCQLHKYM